MTLDSQLGTPVSFAVCAPCQSFWFEMFRSLQLSTASTLKLMKFIGENSSAAKPQSAPVKRCPECQGQLLLTHDWQRNSKFNYWRCANEHGRFISFLDFLREKDFIHPVTHEQLAHLKKTMQTVNCSNCGAPIDLNKDSACTHCGSPICMLDMTQPQKMIEQLQKAGAKPPWMQDPSIALDLAKVMVKGDSPAMYYHQDLGPGWHDDASAFGLVQAGLLTVAGWLVK